MIYAFGAAGPPGYGGITEDNVGEQKPPEPETAGQETPGKQTPGYEGGPEDKSELGNPPSVLEQPLDTRAIVERPLGVPVDQTE